jgi:hypothetical protein
MWFVAAAGPKGSGETSGAWARHDAPHIAKPHRSTSAPVQARGAVQATHRRGGHRYHPAPPSVGVGVGVGVDHEPASIGRVTVAGLTLSVAVSWARWAAR